MTWEGKEAAARRPSASGVTGCTCAVSRPQWAPWSLGSQTRKGLRHLGSERVWRPHSEPGQSRPPGGQDRRGGTWGHPFSRLPKWETRRQQRFALRAVPALLPCCSHGWWDILSQGWEARAPFCGGEGSAAQQFPHQSRALAPRGKGTRRLRHQAPSSCWPGAGRRVLKAPCPPRVCERLFSQIPGGHGQRGRERGGRVPSRHEDKCARGSEPSVPCLHTEGLCVASLQMRTNLPCLGLWPGWPGLSKATHCSPPLSKGQESKEASAPGRIWLKINFKSSSD